MNYQHHCTHESSIALFVKHLKKSFGTSLILKDLSLTIETGKIYSIIGPSGSGKSTLLRLLNNLETPDFGQITINGSIGLVFQNFNLFPHLNILENIIEALIHTKKMPKKEAILKAKKLLDQFDLIDKQSAYPCELSGGQQQRVAIARALALEPNILCFDEPTSALDPRLTNDVATFIRSLSNETMTMIIVTHDMSFAKLVSDQVIFMEHGEIIDSGSVEDVLLGSKNERTKQFIVD